MASKVPSTTNDTLLSLTKCGICLLEIRHPKTLHCLHSFCLECLKEIKHLPGVFTCQLCQEKMTLPPGGVDDFRDNCFINTLTDWKAIQKTGEVKIPCVCCKSTNQNIKACCMNCNGFLCQQCVSLHKTITPLSGHKIFSIDELRSGKMDMNKMIKKEFCKTHKDQQVRWFCKTCNIPICCECAMMDHLRPIHDYITIQHATKGQTIEIKTLLSNCKGLPERLKDAIDETEVIRNNLNKTVDVIKTELDQERKAFMAAIQKSYDENLENLTLIQKEQLETLSSTRKGFELMQSKLDYAMGIANKVIKFSSKYNVASDYPTLCTTLRKLQNSQLCDISKSIGLVKFKSSHPGKIKIIDIGTVRKGKTHRERNGEWVFAQYIGRQGETSYANDIAICPNRSILVADSLCIKLFSHDGKLKTEIKDNLKYPNNIAISSSGFYVADRSPYVKSFWHDGNFNKQFPVISPDGKSSNTDNSKLYAIATDNDGNILVGNYTHKYISKHRTDGAHISSFPIDIQPDFLKVTTNGSIVVTPNKENEPAHILDPQGKHLYTINKPKYTTTSWWPSGIACSDDGCVFIANLSYRDGIHSFTEHGEYLGRITNDVTRPTSLDIYDDKLVVVQWQGLPGKLFTFKDKNSQE